MYYKLVMSHKFTQAKLHCRRLCSHHPSTLHQSNAQAYLEATVHMDQLLYQHYYLCNFSDKPQLLAPVPKLRTVTVAGQFLGNAVSQPGFVFLEHKIWEAQHSRVLLAKILQISHDDLLCLSKRK